MKACPFCAEEIQDAAVFCRHCQHDLKTGESAVKQVVAVTAAPPTRLWSPGIAGLLSFLIPGAGLMYKGQVGLGVVMFIVTVVGYLIFILPGLGLHLLTIGMSVSGDPMRAPGEPSAAAPSQLASTPEPIAPRAPVTADQVARMRKRLLILTPIAIVGIAACAGFLLYADALTIEGSQGLEKAAKLHSAAILPGALGLIAGIPAFISLLAWGDLRLRWRQQQDAAAKASRAA